MPKQCEAILYADDGWNPIRIEDILNKYTTIKEYAYILHDLDVDDNGDLKKAHYHVYMNFGRSNASLNAVAKWYGVRTECIQRIKSNRYYTLKYYLHNGLPDKHQYNIRDIIANFDVGEFFCRKEQVESLNAIIQQCASGIITPFNFTQHISAEVYAKHEVKIKRAWEYADQHVLAQQGKDLGRQVIWVWGDTGTGKTSICHRCCEHEGLPIYQSAPGNDPFSHYAGQPAVILDDLRPGEPYTYVDLLRLLDPHYSSMVHARYRDKIMRCSLIFVTSVLSPETYCAGYHLHQRDDAAQLYRRLSEVWHVTSDHITIQHYDLAHRAFVDVALEPNPWKKFLNAKKIADRKIDGVSMIRSLNNIEGAAV